MTTRHHRTLIANLDRSLYISSAILVYTLNSILICSGTDDNPPLYKNNDISCYANISNSLREFNETSFNVSKRNIFFVETSCKGYLDSRQACAVESAARAHPNWTINALFVGPVEEETLNRGLMLALQSYKNIVISRLNISELVKTTFLKSVYEKELHRSEYPFAHVADIVRWILLWHFTGIFLDLDVVVLKPFDSLPWDFIGMESNNTVGTGVIGLSHSDIGRKIAIASVMACYHYYDPKIHGTCGPKLMPSVLKNICGVPDHGDITPAIKCEDFKVYNQKTFYPISDWKKYFRPGVFNASSFPDSYTAHTKNSISHLVSDTLRPWVFYANMAKTYCPSVYTLAYNSKVFRFC